MAENIPKYLELADWIRKQIEMKKLLPGEKMYSENELVRMSGFSRQTVRHAIGILEAEHIVERMRGSGTYISQDLYEDNSGRRSRIAVIMTYLDNYIFPKTIQVIENELFRSGYPVQIAFTNNLLNRERTILEDILEKDEVAGLIVEATKSALPNMNLSYYQALQNRKILVLFINSFYPELHAPHVSMNDKQAGKMATKYLIEKGHRKISGIFKLDDGQGHLRYAGFMEALNEADIACDESRILWIDTEDIKNFSKLQEKIRDRLEGCSALVSYNDEVAFALTKVLGRMGIRIPEDLSIASIDDSELAVLGKVKLTSVPYPMEKLGYKAAQNLLEMIKNPRFDGTYEFDVHITERDSVRELQTAKSVQDGMQYQT